MNFSPFTYVISLFFRLFIFGFPSLVLTNNCRRIHIPVAFAKVLVSIPYTHTILRNTVTASATATLIVPLYRN